MSAPPGPIAEMETTSAPALSLMALSLSPATSPGLSSSATAPPARSWARPTVWPVCAVPSSTFSSKGPIMTATNPNTGPNSAQLILADTAILKRDLTTILELARATALPMEGETMSVIEAMLGLLQTVVHRVEELGKSVEAVHQK